MTAKAVGTRGSWFATVQGETLPCVHKHWMRGVYYDDPHVVAGDRKWDELIDAIKTGLRVIMTNDDPINEGRGFNRTGYIAEFAVDSVVVEETHLRFRITQRLRELK